MTVRASDWARGPGPSLPDVEAGIRRDLLGGLLIDCDGQEDLYLGELAKAEAGETILDLYNHRVHLYIYPELVVLEDMQDLSLGNNEEAEGPRRCIFVTLAEAKQLILDWLDAKQRWYAERRRLAVN